MKTIIRTIYEFTDVELRGILLSHLRHRDIKMPGPDAELIIGHGNTIDIRWEAEEPSSG